MHPNSKMFWILPSAVIIKIQFIIWNFSIQWNWLPRASRTDLWKTKIENKNFFKVYDWELANSNENFRLKDFCQNFERKQIEINYSTDSCKRSCKFCWGKALRKIKLLILIKKFISICFPFLRSLIIRRCPQASAAGKSFLISFSTETILGLNDDVC